MPNERRLQHWWTVLFALAQRLCQLDFGSKYEKLAKDFEVESVEAEKISKKNSYGSRQARSSGSFLGLAFKLELDLNWNYAINRVI